jgi:TonB-linked SusC/RagA family outer membrane protein
MENILLKKILIIPRRQVYLGIILLFISGFSFAGASNSVSNKSKSGRVNKTIIYATTIKGHVTDSKTGVALPGVTIKIKGSQAGVNTNTNGDFTLQVPDNATLVVSYVGYITTEVPVNGQTNLNIQLEPDEKKLDEVIVLGYGTQKKTSVTAAVSTLNVGDVTQKPVVNLTNDLVGRVAGVIAVQGSGEPGFDGSSFSIRGVGSVGGSAALLIVDGVPRDFSRLDPNTIATVSILKDAAAVAPYGVAGANGVVLVTTKQGTTGAPVLSLNSYYGIQNPTRLPQFVNSYQYAIMENVAAANSGVATVPFSANDLTLFQNHTDPDIHANSQPLKEITTPNRPLSYTNVSLIGGSDNVKYFTSVGYTHQDGMWAPTYLDKYNVDLNLTAKATKTTTVNLSINGSVEDQHFPSQSAGTIIGQAQRITPNFPVRYSNGDPAGYIAQSVYSEIFNSGYGFNENRSTFTQFSINQELPVKGLSLKAAVSYDFAPAVVRNYVLPMPFYTVNGNATPYTYTLGYQGSAKPSFNESYNQNQAFTYQGTLNYARSFGKSDVSFLGVVEERIVKSENFNAARIDYNLAIDELNYGGPAPTDATNGGASSGSKQLGYIYRADYAYNKEYLLEATGSYDGSYLFAPGHRFGFFPAFSVGWVASQEAFIKQFKWIDFLKIRGSYGQVGAYPVSGGNIQTYSYLSAYNLTSNSAVLNGSATQGINEGTVGNPNITWERSNKTDVALEATLFNGLFGIEADYFYEKRSNMLIGSSEILPGEYGQSVALTNAGVMSNHGVELTLRSTHTFSNGLRLDIGGTFTYTRNKLIATNENASTYNNPNRRTTGRQLGTQFGLQALGYYTPADFTNPNATSPTLVTGEPVPSFGVVHPGDIKYADLNGDGKIDVNDNTVIGHPQAPGIIYGLSPHVSYKHFDLDLLIQGSGQSNIQLNSFIAWPFNFLGSASELSYTQYWTPDRTNVLYPRLTTAPTSNNTQTSSWFERNDAYIRIKSAELGYTFSNKLIHNAFKSLRLYVSGENIATWTPWMKEKLDPENSGSDQNYYQQRVFSVGVNAKF